MSSPAYVRFVKGPLYGLTARILNDFDTFLTVIGGPGILCVSEEYIVRLPNESKVAQAFPEEQRFNGLQNENPSRSPGYTGLQGEVKESGCALSRQ